VHLHHKPLQEKQRDLSSVWPIILHTTRGARDRGRSEIESDSEGGMEGGESVWSGACADHITVTSPSHHTMSCSQHSIPVNSIREYEMTEMTNVTLIF
jgi:hypothetical protein